VKLVAMANIYAYVLASNELETVTSTLVFGFSDGTESALHCDI